MYKLEEFFIKQPLQLVVETAYIKLYEQGAPIQNSFNVCSYFILGVNKTNQPMRPVWDLNPYLEDNQFNIMLITEPIGIEPIRNGLQPDALPIELQFN